jgi:hypothetical protein
MKEISLWKTFLNENLNPIYFIATNLHWIKIAWYLGREGGVYILMGRILKTLIRIKYIYQSVKYKIYQLNGRSRGVIM